MELALRNASAFLKHEKKSHIFSNKHVLTLFDICMTTSTNSGGIKIITRHKCTDANKCTIVNTHAYHWGVSVSERAVAAMIRAWQWYCTAIRLEITSQHKQLPGQPIVSQWIYRGAPRTLQTALLPVVSWTYSKCCFP